MRKLLAMILVLAMILCVTACADKDDLRGQVSNNPTETDFSLGSTSGGTYENKFIGIGCTLDENWVYYTDEEILQLNQLTADALDENLAEELEDASSIYDMFAQNVDTGATINVNMENLGLLYGSLLSPSEYADHAMPKLTPALESMGFTDIQLEKTTCTFAGEERTAIRIVGQYNGYPLYEQLVCFKAGNYMAVISVSILGEDATDEILGAFYALEK
ncbi:MAG: hypothetical protein ACI3VZ_06575 [Faecousia sp.]